MAGTVAIGIQRMVGKGRQCHIDHTTKEIWKNIDHEYGRAVLFS